MFRSKTDLDRHVADLLAKTKSESEKSLRGFNFARLYFDVKDYESAKRYLLTYLAVRDQHAAAHKLMGQIHEAMGNLEQALISYKKSLEIEENQKDVVLKICDLYCKLPVDAETARCWVERVQKLYPHHPTVFKLKEKIVKAEGEPNMKDVEDLIASELVARPSDVGLRVRLLRLFLDTRRISEAYKHALQVEAQKQFLGSIDWYLCLVDICQAYVEQEAGPLDEDFMTHYLCYLDRLARLSLSEPHAAPSSLPNSSVGSSAATSSDVAARTLQSFDRVLERSHSLGLGSSGSWAFVLQHVTGQLFFHLATLLLKRATKELSSWSEACRQGAGLLLISYTLKPPANLQQERWFLRLSPSDQDLYRSMLIEATYRLSVSGHIVTALCEGDPNQWLSRIKQEVCIPQVRERIYNTLFENKADTSKSWFLKDSTFITAGLEFPSPTTLEEYDKLAQRMQPESLNTIVWLGLHSGMTEGKASRKSSTCFEVEVFERLQRESPNVSTGNPASFNQMDVLAFVEAVCLCAGHSLPHRDVVHRPLCLPPYAGAPLCSPSQAKWWKAAYLLHTNSAREKLGDLRRELQRGLEVVRGLGNHGMDVRLVIQLARAFADKSEDRKQRGLEADAKALEGRSALYWQLALSLLDRMESPPVAPRERLFPYRGGGPFFHEEARALREEARLFLGVRAMNANCLDEAATIFADLSSAHAAFYLALVLKKLALLEEGTSRKELLSRAKDSLRQAQERTSSNSRHPLREQIAAEIDDLEEQLLAADLTNGTLENGEAFVTGTETTSRHNFTSSPQTSTVVCSTPLVDRSFFSRRLTERSVAKEASPPVVQLTRQQEQQQAQQQMRQQEQQQAQQQTRQQEQQQPQQQSSVQPNPERADPQLQPVVQALEGIMKTLSHLQEAIDRNVSGLQKHEEFMDQILKKVEELSLRPAGGKSRRQREESECADDYGGNYEGDYDHYVEYTQLDPSNGTTHVAASHPAMGYPAAYRAPAAPQAFGAYAAPPLGYPLAPHHYTATPTPAPLVGPRPLAPPPLPPHPFYPPPPNVAAALPLPEGQGLPQFNFDITQPPPAPPATEGRASAFSRLTLTTSTTTLQPSSSPALAPPGVSPGVSPITPLTSVKPSKPGAPHAFQIPLPASTGGQVPAFLAATSTTTSGGTPKQATSTPHLDGLLKGTSGTPEGAKGVIKAEPSPGAGGKSAGVASPSPQGRRTSNVSTGSDDYYEETELEGNFKPLIPLPEEVSTCTGEEDEKVCFEERAKLFRYVDKEWKERGVGTLKLLENKEGKVRLLMRREHVLKVCANHYILGKMSLTPMAGKDTAWIWDAQDFADGEPRPEKFCVRFKTPEIAAHFQQEFNRAVQKSLARVAAATTLAASTLGLSMPTSSPKFTSFMTPAASVTSPFASITTAPSAPTTTSSSAAVIAPSATPVTSIPANTTGTTSTFSFLSAPKFTPASPVSGTTVGTGSFIPWGKQSFASSPSAPATSSSSSTVFNGAAPAQSTPSTFTFGVTKPGETKGQQQPGDASKNVFGGFTFLAPPKVKEVAKEAEKPSAVVIQSSEGTKQSPFAKFSFASATLPKKEGSAGTSESSFTLEARSEISKLSLGSGSSSTQLPSVGGPSAQLPSVSSPSPSSTIKPKTTPKMVTSPGEVPEEFVPNVDFKPVVPLPALIEAKTGEEEEETIFNERAKLFRYDPENKEWKERGVGQLKILRHPDTMVSRVLMRRDQVLKLCANHRICPEMKLNRLSSGDRSWAWSAQDYSEGTLHDEQLAARFKTKEQADLFKEVFERCQEEATTTTKAEEALPQKEEPPAAPVPLSQLIQFKPKPGAWNCDVCYVSNPADKTRCVACETLRPGAVPAPLAPSPLSSLEKLVGTGKSVSSGFPVSAPTVAPAKFTFGIPSKSNDPPPSTVTKPTGFVFGQSAASSAMPTFTFGMIPKANEGEKGVQKEASGVEFKFGSPQKYEFNFSGVRPRSPNKTPKSPCTPAAADSKEEEEEYVESPEADIYFQPVVPLPPKVETRTGEEDEELLYSHRAKLYRWQGGEWKERGLGDIKLLLKPGVPKRVRLVMRREPVLKVCLNHYLTQEMQFSKKDDRTVQWSAADFSDGEPSPHQFALRLKTTQLTDELLEALKRAQDMLREGTGEQKSSDKATSAAASFSFKLEDTETTPPSGGGFSLATRFGSPRQTVVRSLFGNVALALEESDSDEIKILYEARATDAQVALARKLLLPDNFFLYENKPPCPGCRGCEDKATVSTGQSPAAPVNKTSTTTTTRDAGGSTKEGVGTGAGTAGGERDGDFIFSNSSVAQLSFADLASKGATANSSGFLGGSPATQSKNALPLLAGAGTPVFQAATRRRSESGGDDGEVVQSTDVHFEPVVPLPDLVEVTTGEEEEEALFCNRAKLYVFHSETKQWKERAVGEIKILKHLSKPGQFRVLMRRDQVHKVACNHNIMPQMKLMPLSTSANSRTWNAIDYSENKPMPESFAVRFKNAEILNNFQAVFEDCQKRIIEVADSQGPSREDPAGGANKNAETKEEEHEQEVDDDDDDAEDDDDDGDEIMFEKRVTLSIFNQSSGKYESVGMGNLCMYYDDTCFGVRIRVTADESDEVLCETLIAVQTCLRTEKLNAYWTASDVSRSPVVRRQFMVTFSSLQAVEEFSKAFSEGKDCALSASIVETFDGPPS